MKIITLQIKLLLIASILLVCVTGLIQANAQSARPVPAEMEVPFAPIPVKAMDKFFVNIFYDLFIYLRAH